MMQINKAEFVISNSDVRRCPSDGRSEYAFIGRSNVGKSSLINALLRRKDLAKTSQRPGKTQLINHFLVNDRFYVVDLPGYGYAKVPKPQRAAFQRLITSYVYQRMEMVNLFVLIDLRHAPMVIDLDFIRSLGENGVPFSIVFTKADKLSWSARQAHLSAYCARLSEEWEELPPYFVTSATTGEGREELLDYISLLESGVE